MQLRGVNQLQAKTDRGGEGVEKWVLFVAILYGQSQGYVQGEYTYLNAQQRNCTPVVSQLAKPVVIIIEQLFDLFSCFYMQICRIDRQMEGTLPAYVFALMTVYFLQQCEPPVLPVLHEVI